MRWRGDSTPSPPLFRGNIGKDRHFLGVGFRFFRRNPQVTLVTDLGEFHSAEPRRQFELLEKFVEDLDISARDPRGPCVTPETVLVFLVKVMAAGNAGDLHHEICRFLQFFRRIPGEGQSHTRQSQGRQPS